MRWANISIVRVAETALFYLQAAAELGLDEAYFEMYKAHASIASELKAKSSAGIDAALRWTT